MGNETESKAAPKYQLIVFVAAFSAFLATFNETFLNVSFAFVMKDFGVSVGTVQWLATAYMLGAAVMVPVSAFLYRSIKTRPLYLFTVGLLIAGSVIGALSQNFTVLLIGRIVQALGTGMLIPIGMNITLEVAPKQKLGTYMGIMGAMTTLGPSSSVIFAGVLLELFNWHFLLWFFGGLSLLCFLCGAFLLPNVAKLSYPKLDILSVILISLAAYRYSLWHFHGLRGKPADRRCRCGSGRPVPEPLCQETGKAGGSFDPAAASENQGFLRGRCHQHDLPAGHLRHEHRHAAVHAGKHADVSLRRVHGAVSGDFALLCRIAAGRADL